MKLTLHLFLVISAAAYPEKLSRVGGLQRLPHCVTIR